MNEQSAEVQARLLRVLDKAEESRTRRHDLDQLMREAFLTTSSDWAFMVTHDSAAPYARHRAREHARRFHALADRIESGRGASRLTAELNATDGPFAHLDARFRG
jgi:1,4-alpha-glucan branching enzyme